jgi:kynureninase
VSERARAERLDAEDPLASFREQFVSGDPDTIYLDGNSLGRLPSATRERIHRLVEQWGKELVTAWDEWIELPVRVGDLLGEAALGARPGEVIVADSTTVNLYKLAAALLADGPGAIVAPRDEFPTDRYVLDGLASAHGRELRLFESDPLAGPSAEDVERACGAEPVAFVCLSHVNYRSGALADTREIESAAGAPVIWDLSHSAGVLAPEGIGLAVGCTYKYLNAGPGAPGVPIRARGSPARSQESDSRLVRPAPAVRDGAPIRPRARRGRLPHRHPQHSRSGRRGGGGKARRRGWRRPPSGQGGGAHHLPRRAPRRLARAARI